MDAATLKTIIDATFRTIETIEGGHPFLVSATTMLNTAIDANLPAILAAVQAALGEKS